MPRRLVVSALLKRLVLALILLAPGTPAVLSQQVAATAMVQQASAPPTASPPRTIDAPPDDTFQFQALPTPSGAERPFPLNHSFDATGSELGSLTTNAGFETTPTSPGTPPTNADLATAASDVGTPPTNHDFASGDFTGWTTAGSPLPTIDADATRGSWAKLSTSGATITTDAFTVDADAQAFVFDLGYLTTSSLLYVYALTGVGYSTSTQLESFYCPSTCTTGWQSISLNAAPYVGQSIKLKFARSAGQLGVDNVRTQQLLPGYSTSGSVTRATEAGGNAYARLASSGKLTSAAFTIDNTAQFASLQLQGFSGSSIQYSVKVLSGTGFSTVTQVASGSLSVTGSWQTIRFNVASWRGAAVKLRVEQFTGTFGVDNVGLQTLDFPGWDVTGTANRLDDGAGNHYISSGGLLTSDAVVLPDEAQQVSLRYRAETASAPFFVELLHDATFSTVESLGYVAATDTVNWTTVTYNVHPYAGETVKLRIRQNLGRGQYDDIGLGALVAPGWTLTPDSEAIASGTDSHGSYVTPLASLGTMFLESSPLATGIIDRAGTTGYRFYAISYEIGFSTSSLFQVFWVNAAGSSWTVLQDGASSPTGYRTRYFYLTDALGATGHFVIKAVGGGKVYSLADNIARQQVNEPFARKVGLSIDTSTGSFGYSEQDLAVQGAMPLVLSRYYVGQSDQYGTLGYRWSHSYDTRLVVDANGDAGVLFGAGGEEFFDWNAALATFTAADARTHDILVKNGDGSYTFTTKSNLTYHFTSAGVLDTISDLNGNTITLAYDGSGRLATVTDPASQSLTFAYDANGRLATVTDPVNAVVTYGYDANGDLTTVTDPENGVTTYSYDQHRLTSVVDKNTKTLFTNTYDVWHRVTSQADALNKTITLSYDTPGKGATRVTDPENQSATYYFDAQQRTTDQVDPLARVISYVYDSSGNLDKVVDPANNQWEFAYDSSGNLIERLDPLSNPVTITYNAQHLPTTVEDARGNVTTLDFPRFDGHLRSRG